MSYFEDSISGEIKLHNLFGSYWGRLRMESDQIVRMVDDTKETGRQFMQSYQSVWMSRWKRTGCSSTTEPQNGSSNTAQKMKLNCAMWEDNSANKLNVSKSVQGHEDIVTKTFEIVNEGLRMSSESLRKEGMGFQDLPMVPTANCGSGFLFKLGQDTDDMETSRYRDEGTSNNTPEWVQSHSSGKREYHRLSALGGEWFQEMQKVPKCRHNVDTMRICTAMGSAVDPGGSLPRFCQTIHTLRITKKTDFNLENDIFRSTRISGDIPSDVCNLSPLYGQGKLGLKIESLCNFTNSESRGNHVNDSEVAAKNESSVQEKDPLSGSTSIPSKTGINMDCNSSRQKSVAFSKLAEFKRPNTELLDVKLDLRALPTTLTSSEHGDPPSSRTQSLEMDILQTHAKQPKHQSSPFLDNSPVPNPGVRCVKRLKLSSSHSTAQGTKSSSKDQTSFQEKLYDNLGSNPGSAVINSEPTLRKAQGKYQYFSVNTSAKDLELLLSHAWIQRWQRNGSTSTKNKASTTMYCDHQSSNLTPKGLPNEQLPSIAAMALMGRAMNGFQPCELRKRGSFTVWNSRAE